jgi:hypothetical protein
MTAWRAHERRDDTGGPRAATIFAKLELGHLIGLGDREETPGAVRTAHRQRSASGRTRQIGPGILLEALPGR